MSEKQLENLAKAREAAKAKREAAAAQPPPEEAAEEVTDLPLVEGEYEMPIDDPEPEPPVLLTEFDRYVASLPEEIRELLSLDELQAEFDAAEREAKAERRKQLKAQAGTKARDHAKAAAGLLSPEEVERRALAEKMSKKVRVTIRMPFLSDTGGHVSEGVTIDGTIYRHGESYTMPLGRALTIRDIIYRNQQAELDFEGKGRLHGLRQQRAELFNEVRF